MGSLETIHSSPSDRGVDPGVGVGSLAGQKAWTLTCRAMRRPGPLRLTPSDPEFGTGVQSYKASTGRLHTPPDPGWRLGYTENRASAALEQTRAGKTPSAEPRQESPTLGLFFLGSS